MAWYMEFEYDERGKGQIVLEYGDHRTTRDQEYLARTGSIDAAGHLVNALPPGQWFICCQPVNTDEPAMTLEPGEGWKARLYKPSGMGQYERTSYLIHPDAGKPGTLGCIGLKETYPTLKHLIEEVLHHQENLCLMVKVKK